MLIAYVLFSNFSQGNLGEGYSMYNGFLIKDLGLQNITLTDVVIPGDRARSIHEYDKSYDIQNIMRKIRECINRRT